MLALQALLTGYPVTAGERRNVRIKGVNETSRPLDVEGYKFDRQSTCDKKLLAAIPPRETETFDPNDSEAAVWIEEVILVKAQAEYVGLPLVAFRYGGTFTKPDCHNGGKTVFEKRKFGIGDRASRLIQIGETTYDIEIWREPNFEEDLVFRVDVLKR